MELSSKSSVWQKVGASTTNIAVVLTASSPILLINGIQTWRPCAILLWFAYNWIFRSRCIGMMVMGTYLQAPASLLYVSLYTMGFATVLYYWVFPFDLMLANGVLQVVCVCTTGGTLYSTLSGEYTVTAPKS